MKKILLNALLLFAPLVLPAQLAGSYTFQNNSYSTTYIDFYKNGYYHFYVLIYFTDDIVSTSLSSFGRYVKNKDKIILTDQVHGYKMTLVRKGEGLVMKHSFTWIKDKYFETFGISEPYEVSSLSHFMKTHEYTPFSLEKERKAYQLQEKQEFPLSWGLYKNDRYMEFYEFYIFSNNTYILEYWVERNKLISYAGTWSRDGNELILFDTGLQHNFYMLIGENKLISKLLPGDYEGVTLYYQESNK